MILSHGLGCTWTPKNLPVFFFFFFGGGCLIMISLYKSLER